MHDFNLKSSVDDLDLFGHVFAPNCAPQDCRAVISLIHGYSEHSGRYEHMANALNESGIALICVDLRGHGKSAGKRGVISKFSDFYGDVDSMIAETRRRFPDVPHFLMGHSMGGSILFNYKQARELEQTPLSQTMGYIVTAPLLRLTKPAPELLRPLMVVLRKLVPNFTFGQNVDGKDISTLPAESRAYETDPLVHGQLSPALALDMIDKGAAALEQAGNWNAPTLLMHGEADNVTDCNASIEFKAKAGDSVTLRTFENAFHEIHNDICRQDVYNEIIGFISSQLQSRSFGEHNPTPE